MAQIARLNLEKKLWTEESFQDLLIKTKDRQKAKGMVVELFGLAQEYWVPERKLVPKSEIQALGLEMCIEVGMAEVRDEGVYVCGSEEAFAWLFERRESGRKGGVKSAEVRKNKAKPSRAKASSSTAKAHPSKLKQIEPSFSLSSSSSFSDSSSSSESNSNSEIYSVGSEPSAAPRQVENPVGYFIGAYVKAYQARYNDAKARPNLQGKVQGQIKRFLEEVPLDRACKLIQTYCQMNDSWFMTKAYDFGTFVENLSKVGLALDTGQVITRTQIKNVEKSDHARSQLERIARGEL